MGVAHVHPFWNGNGRIARLLANIPVLKAGLPPLTMAQGQRRTYLELLAEYQIGIGQLSGETGVWPDESKLAGFQQFCEASYQATRKLVEVAYEIQSRRDSRDGHGQQGL
jgi:Fic family protein